MVEIKTYEAKTKEEALENILREVWEELNGKRN